MNLITRIAGQPKYAYTGFNYNKEVFYLQSLKKIKKNEIQWNTTKTL